MFQIIQMPNYYPDPNYLDANSPIQSFFDNLIQILTADRISLASSNIKSLSIKSFKSALKEKHNQIFSKTQKKCNLNMIMDQSVTFVKSSNERISEYILITNFTRINVQINICIENFMNISI